MGWLRRACRGAVAQGVGWALLERMAYDAEGRLLSATLLDYALPGVGHVPAVEVALVEVPSDWGPFGAKGVGEPPVIGTAAAIAKRGRRRDGPPIHRAADHGRECRPRGLTPAGALRSPDPAS